MYFSAITFILTTSNLLHNFFAMEYISADQVLFVVDIWNKFILYLIEI